MTISFILIVKNEENVMETTPFSMLFKITETIKPFLSLTDDEHCCSRPRGRFEDKKPDKLLTPARRVPVRP